jgi:hypothetical protein
MIDYKDPIPPLFQFLDARVDVHVYGNQWINPTLPALLVKNAGGNGYTRVQLLARSETDYEAMSVLIQAMNLLERYASSISGLQVVWCEKESNPIPSQDVDTGKAEAWCYMRLEHLEA